jgi:AraC-like DNA-binding protein
MDKQQNQKRIKIIYQMLFEMAIGNLAFRIPKSDHDDGLEKLNDLLNKIAEELQEKILNEGYVNPFYSYQSLVQTTIILNQDYKINSFSSDLPSVTEYKPEDLFKMDFDQLISVHSKHQWEQIKNEININSNFQINIKLIFLTSTKNLIPYFCNIFRLVYSKKIIVSTVTTILQDVIDANNNNPSPRKSDAEIIQNVYKYILDNLEEPLPSAKELSIMFGTNEFKIKDGFRHFFNTSIYQFYNDERLKKAHSFIQETSFPLKEIAIICGFNDYSNFLKAFKKKFNYTPSELNRINKGLLDDE